MDIQVDFISGNCPVQAEGKINGQEFYFRARGEHWSMSIGGGDVVDNPDWYYEEPFGARFEAGWMTVKQARGFISEAAQKFDAQQREPSG